MASDNKWERYSHLTDNYFLDWEAAELCNVPLDVPYMDNLIAQRRRMVEALGIDDVVQLHMAVEDLYNQKKWKEISDPDTNSPWSMLREFEDAYKDIHDDWISP